MPISKVVPGNVFDVKKIAQGERPVTIICGTNQLGNNERKGSVANMIGIDYSSDFLHFPEGEKQTGDIYVRHGNIGEIPTRFIGIVCNRVENSLNTTSDWTFAPEALEKGLHTIYEDATLMPNSAKITEIIDQMKQRLAQTVEISDPLKYFEAIKSQVQESEGLINPISRIVLVGSGESGRRNDADVARILTVMQESSANLHLYIMDQAVQAQVAKVIPLFPQLAQVEALGDFERRIIRVAA